MKPLDGTFAQNALRHGVAGLNIDGGRVGIESSDLVEMQGRSGVRTAPHLLQGMPATAWEPKPSGRWPANLIHDGSDEVMAEFAKAGERTTSKPGTSANVPKFTGTVYNASKTPQIEWGYGDTGTAARFFYCAKASRAERGEGNGHPTVKPLALMRYLLTLTKTPTGGVVLDPFMGSGSTLVAAAEIGRPCIGIELNEHDCEIAAKRLCGVQRQLVPT